MKTVRLTLLAGAAALALAGTAGLAFGQSDMPSGEPHVLTVQLPGGGVEQIEYFGDVAPHIVVQPGFGDGPFAMLDRISAEMDRQAAAMLSEASALASQTLPGFANLGPGVQGFSEVRTFDGNGVCTRSVTITSRGDDSTPQLVSHTSGACGPEGGAAAPAWRQHPRTIEVKANARPYTQLVHPIPVYQQP